MSSSSSSSSSSSFAVPSWVKALSAVSLFSAVSWYGYSLYREFSTKSTNGTKANNGKPKKKVRFQDQKSPSPSSSSSSSSSSDSSLLDELQRSIPALLQNQLDPQARIQLRSKIHSIVPASSSSQIRLFASNFLEIYQLLSSAAPKSAAGAERAQMTVDGDYNKILQLLQGMEDKDPEENIIKSLKLRCALKLRRRDLIETFLKDLDFAISQLSFERTQMEELSNIFSSSAVIGHFNRFMEIGDTLTKKVHIRRFLQLTDRPAYFEGVYQLIKKLKENGNTIN
jgi:hypothetical protein